MQFPAEYIRREAIGAAHPQTVLVRRVCLYEPQIPENTHRRSCAELPCDFGFGPESNEDLMFDRRCRPSCQEVAYGAGDDARQDDGANDLPRVSQSIPQRHTTREYQEMEGRTRCRPGRTTASEASLRTTRKEASEEKPGVVPRRIAEATAEPPLRLRLRHGSWIAEATWSFLGLSPQGALLIGALTVGVGATDRPIDATIVATIRFRPVTPTAVPRPAPGRSWLAGLSRCQKQIQQDK